MNLLAIDTAGKTAAVAVLRDEVLCTKPRPTTA